MKKYATTKTATVSTTTSATGNAPSSRKGVLRKIPSWRRGQMPGKTASMRNLMVRSNSSKRSLLMKRSDSARHMPIKSKSSETAIVSLYGARHDNEDDDDSFGEAVNQEQSMNKTVSDASMGSTSSWAGLNAPWENTNYSWQPNNGVSTRKPSSYYPSSTSLLLSVSSKREPTGAGTGNGIVARNTSEMSLDPMDVLTNKPANSTDPLATSHDMSNINWGSASLSRILPTSMQATPSSLL